MLEWKIYIHGVLTCEGELAQGAKHSGQKGVQRLFGAHDKHVYYLYYETEQAYHYEVVDKA